MDRSLLPDWCFSAQHIVVLHCKWPATCGSMKAAVCECIKFAFCDHYNAAAVPQAMQWLPEMPGGEEHPPAGPSSSYL